MWKGGSGQARPPGPSSPSPGPSSRRRGGNNPNSSKKKEWERSAPEEFLLILTRLRAQYSGGGHTDDAEEEAKERDIGQVINLVRALATRQWELAEEPAALLCHSPLLDTVLARMVVYAATQRNEPDLALEILSGMRETRIDVDAFMASLVAKAAATDRRWMPVVEVIRAQLSVNPGGGGCCPKRAGATKGSHRPWPRRSNGASFTPRRFWSMPSCDFGWWTCLPPRWP